MNFCDLQRFRRKTALLRPKITPTDLQSPRKTAPVRRLTVNRKPLPTVSRLHFHQNFPSLAQQYLLRNGLYPTPGHRWSSVCRRSEKAGPLMVTRVRSSFAYRYAMTLHAKYTSCARLLRSLSFARDAPSLSTRSSARPNSFLAVSGTS